LGKLLKVIFGIGKGALLGGEGIQIRKIQIKNALQIFVDQISQCIETDELFAVGIVCNVIIADVIGVFFSDLLLQPLNLFLVERGF